MGKGGGADHFPKKKKGKELQTESNDASWVIARSTSPFAVRNCILTGVQVILRIFIHKYDSKLLFYLIDTRACFLNDWDYFTYQYNDM
jgi:hypothetical protein